MSSITVWTKPQCVQCTAVIRTLKSAGATFTENDLTDPQNHDQLKTFKSQGVKQVPVIQASTGQFSGFDPDKLYQAISAQRTEVSQVLFRLSRWENLEYAKKI